MARVRVVVHNREIARLLQGEGQYVGVRHDLERRGHRVLAQAGSGHDIVPFVGHDRFRVHVRAETIGARVDEQRTRNLTRALDAAR